MARLWLYGFVSGQGAPAAVDGVGTGPVRLLRHRDVAAVYQPVDPPPGVSAAALRRHDAVVQALLARFPAVVPVRFGETLADVEELRAELAAREEPLAKRLAELRGHVQMTLRVFRRAEGVPSDPASASPAPPPPGDDSRAGPGTRFLEQRRRARAREAALPEIDAVRRALRPLIVRERIVRTEAGSLLGTAYDLVAAGSVDAYRATVGEHAGSLHAYRLSLSGPRPPWAFAEGLGAPAHAGAGNP